MAEGTTKRTQSSGDPYQRAMRDIARSLSRIADSLEEINSYLERLAQPSYGSDGYHLRVLDIGRSDT